VQHSKQTGGGAERAGRGVGGGVRAAGGGVPAAALSAAAALLRGRLHAGVDRVPGGAGGRPAAPALRGARPGHGAVPAPLAPPAPRAHPAQAARHQPQLGPQHLT